MERIWPGCLLGSVLVIFLFIGCSGTRPSNLGVKDSRLSLCPSSLNCVSSQSDDGKHKIDPTYFTSSPAEAIKKLKKVVRGMKRTTMVRETQDYIHVAFRIFLGFVDDAEFFLDGSQKVIHRRSASRVGYWDLEVNRRRMESIREEINRNLSTVTISPRAFRVALLCRGSSYSQSGPDVSRMDTNPSASNYRRDCA